MDRIFSSDGVELAGHLARPRVGPGATLPGLVISHGFPPLRGGGRVSARSFPELADRIGGIVDVAIARLARWFLGRKPAVTEKRVSLAAGVEVERGQRRLGERPILVGAPFVRAKHEDADARVSLNLVGLVPAIATERTRPWGIASLMVGAGF